MTQCLLQNNMLYNSTTPYINLATLTPILIVTASSRTGAKVYFFLGINPYNNCKSSWQVVVLKFIINDLQRFLTKMLHHDTQIMTSHYFIANILTKIFIELLESLLFAPCQCIVRPLLSNITHYLTEWRQETSLLSHH